MSDKIWNGTHTNRGHFHAFGSDLRALCNKRFYSAGSGRQGDVLVGHDRLTTLEDVRSYEYNTICPRCEAQAK